ncbi:tyrosine-type recombinase/integrase [Pendulispora albinea]|uniref:Site-specific integrase n=1 Tax=Pendulispora albinea TaxID=2741071 RepID=A0ABZ2LWR4_9BACT
MTEIDMTGITPLPSGSFRLRMQIGKKKIDKTRPTLAAVLEIRDATRQLLASGKMIHVSGSSIKQLGPAFLASRGGNRTDDAGNWELHIAHEAFAQRAAATVVRRDVLAWLDRLKRKLTAYKYRENIDFLGWQTRKHMLILLRQFFAWALDRDIVNVNPCIGITVKREDGDEDDGYQEGWYLDGQEQGDAHTALTTIKGKDDEQTWFWRAERHIIEFAIGTGLRKGEQFCLHLTDVHVDGENPHVVVRHGSWDPKKQRYRPPKGRTGEKKTRIVPLFGLGLASARAWLALLPRYTKKNPHGLMFPNTKGGRRTKPPTVWNTFADKLGIIPHIGRRIWWHLLRHTCASSLVAGWWGTRWSLEDVSKYLGHSSVKVTERYAHLTVHVLLDVASHAETAWQATLTRGRHLPQKHRKNGHFPRPSKPNVVCSNQTGRAQSNVGRENLDQGFDGRESAPECWFLPAVCG